MKTLTIPELALTVIDGDEQEKGLREALDMLGSHFDVIDELGLGTCHFGPLGTLFGLYYWANSMWVEQDWKFTPMAQSAELRSLSGRMSGIVAGLDKGTKVPPADLEVFVRAYIQGPGPGLRSRNYETHTGQLELSYYWKRP